MKKKEITFVKEKISTEVIRGFPHLMDAKLHVKDDPVFDALLYSIDAFFFSRMREEKEVTYHPPRQKFWDWIRGKKPKSFTVKINCKDVLVSPPKTKHNTLQLFEAEILN